LSVVGASEADQSGATAEEVKKVADLVVEEKGFTGLDALTSNAESVTGADHECKAL